MPFGDGCGRTSDMRLRTIISLGVTAVATIIIVPFLQTPAAKLAETTGFDKILSDRWGAIMSTLSQFLASLTSNPWYIFLSGVAVGAAGVLWIDLKIKSAPSRVKSATPDFDKTIDVKDRYVRQELNIVDLVKSGSPLIADRTFEKCVIKGPAFLKA